MTRHTHAPATTSAPYPYAGPVAEPERVAAHGGCCVSETCACGKVRAINASGGFLEVGEWMLDPRIQAARDIMASEASNHMFVSATCELGGQSAWAALRATARLDRMPPCGRLEVRVRRPHLPEARLICVPG